MALWRFGSPSGTPTPNMGVLLGVWGFIPSHSLHSWEHVKWFPSLPFGSQPCNPLALVANPRLRLWQFHPSTEKRWWVVNFFSEFLIKNFNSRTRKNSPNGSDKTSASMAGGMFVVATIYCWRERVIEVGIEFGLFGTVPWCAMVVCNGVWEAVAMVVA